MAEIITIASRKGGVGKTTIAINMVVALSNKGKTLLVDADEQQSAMKWNKHRTEKIDAISVHKDLIAELEKLDGEYQYILIDVAGRDSEIFREALLISDKLIVPTQASLLDLDVIPYLNEKVKTAKKTNPNLVSMVVINRASTNAKSNETEQAREFVADYEEFKLLQTTLHERKQYRDAVLESKSVLEMAASKAKDELNQFLIEVL